MNRKKTAPEPLRTVSGAPKNCALNRAQHTTSNKSRQQPVFETENSNSMWMEIFRDHDRFKWLVSAESGPLSKEDCSWVSDMCIFYLGALLALEDCYDQANRYGKRQGLHNIDSWAERAASFSEDKVDAELSRLIAKIETQIGPWVDRVREGRR